MTGSATLLQFRSVGQAGIDGCPKIQGMTTGISIMNTSKCLGMSADGDFRVVIGRSVELTGSGMTQVGLQSMQTPFSCI
jgi:hypothetical protein